MKERTKSLVQLEKSIGISILKGKTQEAEFEKYINRLNNDFHSRE